MEPPQTQAADPDGQVAGSDAPVGSECLDLQSLTMQPEDLAATAAAIAWQGTGGEQTTDSGLDPSTDGGETSELLLAPAMSVTAPAESAPAGSESLPHPAGTVATSIAEGSIGSDDVATAPVEDGTGNCQTAQVGLDGATPFNVSNAPSAVLFVHLASAPAPPSLAGWANPTALFGASPTAAGGANGVNGGVAGQAYDGLFGDQMAHVGLGVTSPSDGAGITPAGPYLAHARPESASADLAHLTDPAAGLSGGAHTNASIGSGGATAAQVQQALDEAGLSVDGFGIKVGVLSDSFNNLGGAATDEASGALPPASHVQVLSDLASGGSDEGRAMMQIVHDIAPSASLAFYTAFNGAQDFANGILALAAAGCKVICDDVSYFDEPFFQNGVVAKAIQTVEAQGVTYVAAAGNDASNGYQANWSSGSGSFDGVTLADAQKFGTSLVQTVTVNSEGTGTAVPLLLEWNQAYGHATSNLELLVFSNGQLVGTATNTSSGEPTNPWVRFDFAQTGTSAVTYQVAIENLAGPSHDPGLIKEVTAGDGLTATISGANSGTVVGHAMTPGAITAGAVSAADTPAFGVGPAVSEGFSSSGLGTELLFDNNGNQLASPDPLSPVVVSGLDDINTTVPGLTDFLGTSAASASLAGVAALILQDDPNLTPAQVEQFMKETALPMSNSAVSGAGLVQVDAAIAAAPPYVIQTDTNAFGSAKLVESGGEYLLDSTGGTGPVLKYGGTPVVMGGFGGWAPIGAVPTASGYDVAWKLAGANAYSVWNVDGTGNYIRNIVGVAPGNNLQLEVLERTFNQDLNGDGRIGPPRTDFVFDSQLTGQAVRIAHFNPAIDKIVLSATDFPGIRPIGHPLAAADFHAGPYATTGSQRIIYHSLSGFLDYHPAGSGPAGQIHFATVSPHLALMHTDFLVVA